MNEKSIKFVNIHGLENVPVHPVPITDFFVIILTLIDLQCVITYLILDNIRVDVIWLSEIIIFGAVKLAIVDCYFSCSLREIAMPEERKEKDYFYVRG